MHHKGGEREREVQKGGCREGACPDNHTCN